MPDYLDLFQQDTVRTPVKTHSDRVRDAEKAARKQRRSERAKKLSRRNAKTLRDSERSRARRRHLGRP